MTGVAIPAKRRNVAKRAAWTLLDQGTSAIGNAALSVVVARSVTQDEFGAFALAFSVYTFSIGVSQAFSGQVVSIRFSGAVPQTRRLASTLAASTSLAVGAALALPLLFLALLLRPPINEAIFAVAITLPALLLQDSWRTIFIASGAPQKAFINDLTWSGTQLLLIVWLIHNGIHETGSLLAAWGATAVLAAALGFRQLRVWPRINGLWHSLRTNIDLSLPLLGQWVAIMGMAQIALIVIAAIAGVPAVGAIRAAQTLLGPVNVIALAAQTFAVPEMVRALGERRTLLGAAMAVSGAILAAEVVWGTALLVLPNSVGHQILGSTWQETRSVLPAILAFTILTNLTVGCTTIFRATDRTRYALYTSAALGPLMLVLSAAGASTGRATGAAIGFAAAAGLVAAPTWALALRADRLGRAPATPRILTV